MGGTTTEAARITSGLWVCLVVSEAIPMAISGMLEIKVFGGVLLLPAALHGLGFYSAPNRKSGDTIIMFGTASPCAASKTNETLTDFTGANRHVRCCRAG